MLSRIGFALGYALTFFVAGTSVANAASDRTEVGIGVFIVVACAATLHVNGCHIHEASDAAVALRPLASWPRPYAPYGKTSAAGDGPAMGLRDRAGSSRSVTGFPGRSECWGVWGAISGPPHVRRLIGHRFRTAGHAGRRTLRLC